MSVKLRGNLSGSPRTGLNGGSLSVLREELEGRSGAGDVDRSPNSQRTLDWIIVPQSTQAASRTTGQDHPRRSFNVIQCWPRWSLRCVFDSLTPLTGLRWFSARADLGGKKKKNSLTVPSSCLLV